MEKTIWIGLKGLRSQYGTKVTGAQVQLWVSRPTQAVSPDTVIFEVKLDIDLAIFDYPTLNLNLKPAPIEASAIMAELKEWVGEKEQ